MSIQVFDDRVEVVITDRSDKHDGNTLERDEAFRIIDAELGMFAWFTDRFADHGLAVWTFTPMGSRASAALETAN